MSKPKALPKEVFCQWVEEEKESYALVVTDANDLACVGKTITAGHYKLVETVEITAEEPVVTVKAAKRK